jgi:hypothetical protein
MRRDQQKTYSGDRHDKGGMTNRRFLTRPCVEITPTFASTGLSQQLPRLLLFFLVSIIQGVEKGVLNADAKTVIKRVFETNSL